MECWGKEGMFSGENTPTNAMALTQKLPLNQFPGPIAKLGGVRAGSDCLIQPGDHAFQRERESCLAFRSH